MTNAIETNIIHRREIAIGHDLPIANRDPRGNPMKTVLAGLALAALATAAQAYPVVQSHTEVEHLRGMLLEQSVDCPKVDGAWYMTNPEDATSRMQVWKVSCSDGKAYGLMFDRENEMIMVQSWAKMDEQLG
jgi:hypothetical protein